MAVDLGSDRKVISDNIAFLLILYYIRNMKRSIRTILKISLTVSVLLLVYGIYFSLNLWSEMFGFEDQYSLKEFYTEEINTNGVKFIDRNNNKLLDIYEDSLQSIEFRVDDLLSKMTTEEKIHLLKGSGMKSALGLDKSGISGAVGTIVSIPRLGIPSLYLSDGPAGLRINPVREDDEKTYYCTAFPIASSLASTWNTDLVSEVGNAMGNEALRYGIDIILGPGANIHRNPLCGRNFEYYSEDPVLSGNIGASMVNGIESNGVGSSVKHFVANNQENSRKYNDAIVSERALREIYLKGFEIIVKKSQPWSIMTSYNKINGIYSSENKHLLTDILKSEWGFKGMVMTDWFAGNNATEQINAGNDLLEPGTKSQWQNLKKSFDNGKLPIKNIDLAVKRILNIILRSKKMQDFEYDNNPDLIKHAEVNRRSAAEGMVLLKNDGMLPIKTKKNIALIGITSYNFISGGSGSGDVNEAYTVSLEDGLENLGFEINSVTKNAFLNHFQLNKKEFTKPEFPFSILTPYHPPEMDYSRELLRNAAQSSDMAIITIGRNSGEFVDRQEENDFMLSKKEINMIKMTCQEFHSLNKKVLVVLNIGGVIETNSWKKLPDSILLAWQGGQEGGNSVTDIISGIVNPSGKLPMTFPINLGDHLSSENFPLEPESVSILSLIPIEKEDEKVKEEQIKNKDFTLYKEGIYVGYRHFDTSKIDVSYPFGYGLSYTNFKYSELEINNNGLAIDVSLKITNTGDFKGKEVVQIYISKINSKIDRPIKELKAFSKTPDLSPNEFFKLDFNIPVSDFSYWSEKENKWKVESGTYSIKVGSSSRNIILSDNINI